MTTQYAFIDGKWKPLVTPPREIRRGRNKGRIEVGVQKMYTDGIRIQRCIIDQEALRGSAEA